MPSDIALPKNTLTGFRQILDVKVEPPRVLTRAEWSSLSDEERLTYDEERLHWFGAAMWIKTPLTRSLLLSGKTRLRTSSALTVGETGIVLTGPTHVGKTTSLFRLADNVEGAVRRRQPTYREDGVVPVVYVEVPPSATPKTMAAQIVHFFGTPFNYQTSNQQRIIDMAVALLRNHRTQVLIIDEVQMLQLGSRTSDSAVNTLKTLMNQSGTLMVFAGIDLRAEFSSHAADQIMSRCEVIEVERYGEDDESRAHWHSIVREFGNQMLLVDVEASHLDLFADPLLAETQGSLGRLRILLSNAMTTALRERESVGAERITSEMLFGQGSGLGATVRRVPRIANSRPSTSQAKRISEGPAA